MSHCWPSRSRASRCTFRCACRACASTTSPLPGDRIYTAPEDYLDLKGLRLEATFFKNTLDKVGAQMEVEHVGKYKDAFNAFTHNQLTPESREVYNELLDQYYNNLADVIAQGRKKKPEDAKAIIDKGPFVAREALNNGLVDVLGYEDQVYEDLKAKLSLKEVKKLAYRDYIKSLSPDTSRPKIALVVGQGTITQGSGNESPFGGDDGITAAGFGKLLRRVKDDSSIKGVIVRVDSPGGDAIASDDILHEMKELSAKKPTVISMGDVAASGGYFIAVTGDPIIAYPNTITGSIGVITAHINLHSLYDKIGIQKELLTRGHFAAMDSDYKPMTPEERAKLRSSIEATYRGFVTRVANGRKKKYEEIDELAQGRVWVGAQAKQQGLVDELGGLDRAVELVKQKAKIGADQKVLLVPYPPRRSLFDVLMSHLRRVVDCGSPRVPGAGEDPRRPVDPGGDERRRDDADAVLGGHPVADGKLPSEGVFSGDFLHHLQERSQDRRVHVLFPRDPEGDARDGLAQRTVNDALAPQVLHRFGQ